mgnify:CR=1 FL=1|jgi:aryl-alcohol dehydrogenase-like predicted oxidoreductase
MQTVKLGTSGLEVSRVCLGGMSFGDPSRGNQDISQLSHFYEKLVT